MAQRIKGQEVEAILIVNGVPQTNITAIKSFEFAFQLEIQSEGYLGETTDRKDSVFKGIRGSMEMHLESQAVFELIRAIVDKARRREPGTRINLKATLNFPNGDRPRVIIPDCEFGEHQLLFGRELHHADLANSELLERRGDSERVHDTIGGSRCFV